jgi:alcohol dehydrogenase class IV
VFCVEPYWAKLPHILTGVDVVKQVGELAKNLGGKKILVITDQGVIKAGLLDKVQQSLEESRIEFGIFDKCEPDAPVGVIISCAQFAKEGGYDLFVGLGGGSSMDTAKLSAVAATEDNIRPDIISQYTVNGPTMGGLPSIMIATTAGSGAEVSEGAVVTDTDGVKKAVHGCMADIAIVDPMMTLNLPAEITADTGIDALSHSLESYVHPKANILCETLGGMAIKMISENLRLAYNDGPNRLDARYNMAVGATWSLAAGMMSPFHIMVHMMGYSFQKEAKITHGRSISLMLPHVMEFNLMTNLPKYAKLAQIMGENIEGLSLREAAMKSINAVRNLSQDIGLPQRLRDIGLGKNQISSFVDSLFTRNEQDLLSNPRQVSREDAARIYEAAW